MNFATSRDFTSAPGVPSSRALAIPALLLLTLFSQGCSGLRGTGVESAPLTAPRWPPPPAEPRIQYVGSISGDVGLQEGLWTRLVHSLSGTDRETGRLNRPFGLTLDDQENLCLADPGAGVVYFFDRKKRDFTRWSRIGDTDLIAPVSLAKKGDLLFVADTELRKVIGFTLSGEKRFEIFGKVERPASVAVAGNSLFVADAQAHSILVFDLTGKPLAAIGSPGKGPGEFNTPTHIAVSGGMLYVTDSMNFRVQAFDHAGRHVRSYGGVGDGSGHFSRPKGVAVDSFGHVYVVDTLFDNVQIFNPDGAFLLDWGTAGSDPGQFWMPAGIAITRDNMIFVADSYNQRIQVFRHVGRP